MICPHCKKEIGQEEYKEFILNKILHLIGEKDGMSIAEIQREIGMKRNTLIYYLQILNSKRKIDMHRVEEKERGRPTRIKIKKGKKK